MKFRFNIKPLEPRRRQLRKRSTNSEVVLWKALRNKNQGFRFVRQFSIDGYVMDFYCPEKRLAIEIEGGIHKRPKVVIYDDYRQRYLESFGVKILKFTNEEVSKNLRGLLKVIKLELGSPRLG